MRTLHLLVAVFAAAQCARYGRGALLFLAPRVRVSGEPGAQPGTALRLRLGAALEELGFAPLGAQRRRAALGALSEVDDVYANPELGVYADVVREPAARAGVVFFTPFARGGAVLTASFRRQAVAAAHVQAGGIPDAPLPSVLAAHRVAAERFAERYGPPEVRPDLEARLEASRRWLAGEGRRELRRANRLPFAIALLAVALLASSVRLLLAGG